MANNEYIIIQGIDYPPKNRAEAGEVVNDLPKNAVPWLLESGIIKPAPVTSYQVAPKSKQTTVKKEVADEL